ncbi:DUF6380 family protein [Streptomyces sp. NPDC056628]|uniref:DUF6380 family protein n=1 Tax=Streptomyces sp. NPDC056628 TaxID=3345882 RepID=UPI00369D8734
MDHTLGGESLGRVRRVPPAVRRPAGSPERFEQGEPPLAAPDGSPRATGTWASVRHAGSTRRTPLGPPSGRTTRLRGPDGGGKRRATLRGRTASLTTTTDRTASGRTHGGRTGEGAR